MPISRTLKWLLGILVICALVLTTWLLIRLWPPKLPAHVRPEPPKVFFERGKLGLALPTQVLVATVGNYPRILQAYLNFDFLRSQKSVVPRQVLLCPGPGSETGQHRLQMEVPNDILRTAPFLAALVSEKVIPGFTLYGWLRTELSACREQSQRVAMQFRSPPRLHLYQIPDKSLIGPMADFLVFKSKTDIRVLRGDDKDLGPLTVRQARQLAEDILVISRFYSLPIDYFLAIGAMENNYLSVRGDLGHTVWKRRPQPGDVVLRRRRGLVLVRNYSLGVWQITLDTLRYAQLLYLRDRQVRDYSTLPKRLRPQAVRNPDDIRPETLTTYAGLLFRNLLDRFNGNVMLAVGAYNGGADHPNRAYADSVRRIALYAYRVLYHAVEMDRQQREESRKRGKQIQAPPSAVHRSR